MNYLLDPVFHTTFLAAIFMCYIAGLIGVISFLQRRALIAEMFSHASYPGVILGGLVASFLSIDTLYGVLVFSAGVSFISLYFLRFLEKRKVSQDTALCFVLSTFFAIGVLMASRLQITLPSLYKKLKIYLFGQVATVRDEHVWLYGMIGLVVTLCVVAFYPRIQMLLFDRNKASLHMKTKGLELLLNLFFILAIGVGIRTVGVVLMSSMLIAPAVFARSFVTKLSHLFVLSSVFGMIVACLGVILSIELSLSYDISMPPGPLISILGTVLALLALIFSHKRGVFYRKLRIMRFKCRCLEENILKSLCKCKEPSFQNLKEYHPISKMSLYFLCRRLQKQGFLQKDYQLTKEGRKKGIHIIRLHRLWEVYLTEFMGMTSEKVHASAEEMEHIITPRIEKRLNEILSHPTTDPHQRPIPRRYDESLLG